MLADLILTGIIGDMYTFPEGYEGSYSMPTYDPSGHLVKTFAHFPYVPANGVVVGVDILALTQAHPLRGPIEVVMIDEDIESEGVLIACVSDRDTALTASEDVDIAEFGSLPPDLEIRQSMGAMDLGGIAIGYTTYDFDLTTILARSIVERSGSFVSAASAMKEVLRDKDFSQAELN